MTPTAPEEVSVLEILLLTAEEQVGHLVAGREIVEKARAELARLRAQQATCVYCGLSFDSGARTITEHVQVCEKHPMRPLEQQNAALRKVGRRVVELAEFYQDLDDAPAGAVPAWDLLAIAINEARLVGALPPYSERPV